MKNKNVTWIWVGFLIVAIIFVSGCTQPKYVCPGNKVTVDDLSECPAVCGDDNCQTQKGESVSNCPIDCSAAGRSGRIPNCDMILDSNYNCVTGGI